MIGTSLWAKRQTEVAKHGYLEHKLQFARCSPYLNWEAKVCQPSIRGYEWKQSDSLHSDPASTDEEEVASERSD